MCGIVGYIGNKKAAPILLDGLKALEYRGYDSAGLFVYGSPALKSVGSVETLITKTPSNIAGKTGIAHTRWATHGLPTEINAHPHCDCSGRLWLVHNGIIENYKELKSLLHTQGHVFQSETDSEILVHLIEEELKTATIEEALVGALKRVEGTYGIALIDTHDAEKLLVARMGSPIVFGMGDSEYIVASDPSAILRHTKNVLYLHDGEIAFLTPTGHRVFTTEYEAIRREPEVIEWDIEQVQKGGFPHFMLKEIMEVPDVLINSARGRLIEKEGRAKLGGLEEAAKSLQRIKRLIIVGCGSAYYAGLVGKYMIEELSSIPVDIELGSEFRYRKAIFDEDTALLAISQSGETADTLASIKEAKRRGLLTLGIVNVVGSTIARETDAGVYNHAGPEIGVASTKAFISQLEVLALLALFLGRQRNLSLEQGQMFARELQNMPAKIRLLLDTKERIASLARNYADFDNFLYMGRKYNFPIAYEGALKLKEVSYIHAEGYGAGEMKHGPIAMIDESFPTLAITPKDSVYEKMISNIEEIKTRRGKVLAIATEGDAVLTDLADDCIYIPPVSEILSPILTVIPLQLFAYYIGVLRGYNVDRPRNLAKSVTVE